MAVLALSYDPAKSELGELVPVDLELAAVVIDIFYLVSQKNEYGKVIFESYDAYITKMYYGSPFSIFGKLRDISVSVGNKVLDRILFFQQERQKREIENVSRVYEAISKKLDCLEKARELRIRLIKDGINEAEATKMISEIIYDQGFNIQIIDPDRSKL